MVKITDPLKELDLEKTPEEKKELHDIIEKKQIKDIQLLLNTEEKKINQTVRLPESLINSLKVYCKVNNISINSVIEEFLIEKFKDKRIIRDKYELEEETIILVPTNIKLLHEYIEKEVNLIANFKDTVDGTNTINLFDKQATIYNNNPEMFKIIQLKTTNNYLDSYDSTHECYFTEKPVKSLEEELDVFLVDEKYYTSHLGLIVLQHHEVTTIETPEIPSKNFTYIKEDRITTHTTDGTYVTVFLLVHEFDNKIIHVKLITPHQALKYAEEVDNIDIINYIEDNLSVAEISDIEKLVTDEAELVRQIQFLTEVNSNYQEEHLALKDNYFDLKTENLKLKMELEKLKEYSSSKGVVDSWEDKPESAVEENIKVDPKTIEEIYAEIGTNKELLETSLNILNTTFNRYEKKINELNKIIEENITVESSEDVSEDGK